MPDKEKQIAEIVEIDMELRKIVKGNVVKTDCYSKFGGFERYNEIWTRDIAEALYSAGYRKIPDGYIVLSPEQRDEEMREINAELAEHEQFVEDIYEYITKARAETRMETAKDIFSDIRQAFGLKEDIDKWDSIGLYNLYKGIERLEQKYGVEVEE